MTASPHSKVKKPSQNLPQPGQAALLRACLCPSDEFSEHWRTWRGLEDIDHLDESSNRLLPLLYRQAEKSGLCDAEMGRLRGIYRYQWCRNHLMLSELRKVLAALRAESIEVILLKGSALIQRYYVDPALRPMSDLDFMVYPDRFEDASAVLLRYGYARRIDIQFKEIREKRLTHAVEFTRTVNGQTWEIDLHWTPLHRATWPGAHERFWENSVVSDFKGVDCRIFDATDQLLHVCLHGALWNALPPLRWIVDAMWILRGERIDWLRLMDHARYLNSVQLLQMALNYLREMHDAPIPEHVMDSLNAAVPSRYERLLFRLQTSSSYEMRADQLLVLGWMNHSRAYPDMPWWRLLGSFPSYLKTASKISRWRDFPAHMARRLLRRS